MSASLCRSCRKPIQWAQTVNGRQMPLDPAPDPAGNVKLTKAAGDRKLLAVVLGGVDLDEARLVEGAELYRPHWSTCPNPKLHRRNGTRTVRS